MRTLRKKLEEFWVLLDRLFGLGEFPAPSAIDYCAYCRTKTTVIQNRWCSSCGRPYPLRVIK